MLSLGGYLPGRDLFGREWRREPTGQKATRSPAHGSPTGLCGRPARGSAALATVEPGAAPTSTPDAESGSPLSSCHEPIRNGAVRDALLGAREALERFPGAIVGG